MLAELKDEINEAILESVAWLAERQRPDGSWGGDNTAGALYTAFTLVTESFVGRLTERDAREGARWLERCQHPSGGVPSSQGLPEADLDASCCVYAALSCAGVLHADDRMQELRRFIHSHGGFDGASLEIKVFACMAGLYPAVELPRTAPLLDVVPGIKELAANFVLGHGILGFALFSMLISGLRAGRGGDALGHGWRGIAAETLRGRLASYAGKNGGCYCVTFFTLVLIATCHLLGDKPGVARGLQWLNARKSYGEWGMKVACTTSEVWDTALVVDFMARASFPRGAESTARGVDFLERQQVTEGIPRWWNNPRRGAPSSGGWAFGADTALADPDTTGVVLGALAAVPHAAHTRVLDRGERWLLSMQQADGGWPAFTRNWVPPWESSVESTIVDKSAYDITGRVLTNYCRLGSIDRAVCDAGVKFLRGGLSRAGHVPSNWFVNHIAGTSSVLEGLVRTGAQDCIEAERATRWLLDKQNQDGGWGESLQSYRDPRLAGVGPSSPTSTAFAIIALAAVNAEPRAVEAGVRFLLDSQTPSGGWVESAPRGVLLSARGIFYVNELIPLYTCGKALSAAREMFAQRSQSSTSALLS